MAGKGISFLKFVGTVSLGLLTGVSYSVSAFTLPALLQLPSSVSASQALASLTSTLELPLLALSSLSAGPLFLSFIFSPRSARHPYLFYTSLLAVLSAVAPLYLPQPPLPAPHPKPVSRNNSARARMEASYEVLGDVHSEGDPEGSLRTSMARSLVRTGLAAAGFLISVIGLWGDGAPRVVVRA
ncbi:Autophagy-related protein 33 [Cladobotryum mycophilum]|uniref:Autophagy-related protein 33 n=1 Tax=Cladobotryum mycophilum TaxID=491253 RepID=A0ABR0SFW4_9HYPO